MIKYPAEEERDPHLGTTFRGYEIESVAGVGAMGKVYRASTRDGARVAVKIANPECAGDERFRARFEQEAVIARTVRNEHLIPVLEVGEDRGRPYMVKPYIDGPSLEYRLRRLGRLTVAQTIAIAVQVADALEALWAAGMVHRDVKPANILLDRSGNAFLTDFGLAKNIHGRTLTRPGETMGSLPYMAPEQIRTDPLTEAADLYSLGCVVFECLHGEPPFGRTPAMKVLWAQIAQSPPDLDELHSDISPDLAAAVNAALAKEAEDRPAGATDYVELLAGAAGIALVELAG